MLLDFLQLSDMYGAKHLRSAAKRFAITHLKEMKATDGWKDLMDHNPHLADDIMDELADLMTTLTSTSA